MQTILKIVMAFSMIGAVASIIFLFILVILKKQKKVVGLCLIISVFIFIITYVTERVCPFDDISDTLGKEQQSLADEDTTSVPREVADNLSVTPCYPDNGATGISVIINNGTLSENIQNTSEDEADNLNITPIPEDTANSEEQAMQQAMKEQWYMFKRLFVREDGLHTFRMGWWDGGTLWCVLDGNFHAATVEKVDTSLSGVLVYEGIENHGSVKITYYYDEEKIEIIDLLGLDEDYSGIYYLDKSSVIEPDIK